MANIAKKQAKGNRDGTVLPLAVMAVVILFFIGMALIRLGLDARMRAVRTTAEIAARIAADAGFTQAKRLMDIKLVNKPWDGSSIPPATVSLPNSYSNTSFNYTVTDEGSYYLITSTGRSGIAEKTVKARLFVETLWFGIGVKENIDIKLGATFSTDPPDADFSIRTNSTDSDAVTLKAGVTIPGDVICGQYGVVDEVINIKATTVIEGDAYAAKDKIDFPDVVLDANFASMPTTPYIYAPNTPIGNPNSVTPQYFRFDSIDIPGGAGDHVQEIQGPAVVYVEGKTTLGQSASIVVTEGSSLTLYLGGDLEAKNSVGLDNLNNGSPDALIIYGLNTCENIDLKAKGEIFFGYVYAPDADLDVYAKNELAGSFIGESFTLMNATNFTYIPPSDANGLNNPTSYLMQRWWEE